MSESIKVGDLVQVIKPKLCCGEVTPMLGRIFTVARTYTKSHGRCSFCGAVRSRCGVLMASSTHTTPGFHVERLKLLPALAEFEGQCTEESIEEPA